MRITCVVDDCTGTNGNSRSVLKAPGKFISEHGLSLLIENNDGKKVIMDTGSSEQVFSHNLSVLGIRPEELDAVFITHGHDDHLGGLPLLLKAGVPCYSHSSTFKGQRFYSASGNAREIGPSTELLALLKEHPPFYENGPKELVSGISTTGEVMRTNSFEVPSTFILEQEGVMIPDHILEEQALVLSTRKGLIVVTGCGHAGVVNILSQVRKRSERKLYMVMGGFHLSQGSPEALLKTMDGLKKLGVEKVVPTHCTGFQATKMFSDRFPGFELFGTGCYIDI
ncbi:MAG: MBL fold metallo-hydrolase [Methanomassiliicoccales archaeon]|nr:MBL fold metallo-hydrolase [Methanomassiliicoccales archaeon]